MHQGRLWLVVCAFLAAGVGIGCLVTATSWDWQPALALRQPWRWWTAAWVHLSALHVVANLAGLFVVAALGRSARLPAIMAVAWLASWPLVHLALLGEPGLMHYAGLSGVLHAGVAVAAVFVAVERAGTARRIGMALLVGLGLKVFLESPWGPALQPMPGWDFAVAPLAHASGAAAGTLCALLALARGKFDDADPEVETAATETKV